MDSLDFYSFQFAQPQMTGTTAAVPTLDEELNQQKNEGYITIRRIFAIDPKMVKELGSESAPEQEGNPSAGTEQASQQTGSGSPDSHIEAKPVAQDEAIYLSGIAMDLSPRHAAVPLEDCKAQDPMYCPYHGASHMTKMLMDLFKADGIYAHGGIEKLGGGKFRLQVSVPPSKREQANNIINGFLQKPGFKDLTAEESESDDVDELGGGRVYQIESMKDRQEREANDPSIPENQKFNTPLDAEKPGHTDKYGQFKEYLDMLRADQAKGMPISDEDIDRLEAERIAIGQLWKSAHKALNDELKANAELPRGQRRKITDVKAGCQPWQDYVGLWKKFEDDYNTVRGNADLNHVQSPEDAMEVATMINSQLDELGDFVKADKEIRDLKESKGLTGVRGIAGTGDYNTMSNRLVGQIGVNISAARAKLSDAVQAGDIKRMRGALHTLESALDEAKERQDEIKGFMKLAADYKKVIEDTPSRNEPQTQQPTQTGEPAPAQTIPGAASSPDPDATAAQQTPETPPAEQPAPAAVSPNEEPNPAEVAAAPEQTTASVGETGTTQPETPAESHVETPAPYNEHTEGTQTSNSEASIEHNEQTPPGEEQQTAENQENVAAAVQSTAGQGESSSAVTGPTDDDFLDAAKRLREGNSEAFNDGNVPLEDIAEDLKNVAKGGTAVTSGEIAEAERILGADNPVVKAIRDAAGTTNQENDLYTNFLLGNSDDRANLYGDAGLSADHEYDTYLKKMDDAVDAAQTEVNAYTGEDKNAFAKSRGQQLRDELRSIADEQSAAASAAERQTSAPAAQPAATTPQQSVAAAPTAEEIADARKALKEKFFAPLEDLKRSLSALPPQAPESLRKAYQTAIAENERRAATPAATVTVPPVTEDLKERYREYNQIGKDNTNEDYNTDSYYDYIAGDDGDAELQVIRDGWSNPGSTFAPAPELADYLDAVRQLPKDQGVKALADLGMKQTETTQTSSQEQNGSTPLSMENDKYAVYYDVLQKFNEKHGTTGDNYGEIKSLMESAQNGTIDLSPAGGGIHSNDMQFLDDIREAVGNDHPYIKEIDKHIAALRDRNSNIGTQIPSQQPTPQQENQEVPPEDIQSGSATAGASAATPPEQPPAAQPSEQPQATQPAASEATPAAQPATPAASQPSTPTGPVNTDENINSFKDAISSAIPTFKDFFRQGRDIAILTDEDDNGETTAAQSVEAVRNLMREHGIKGAMMPFPVESQQGPNAPKKICYMIKMTKAAPTTATTT